ncbi:odorant receptor 63a isoform X1 [Drosophila simulans]|uniref:odorant receptor 63a isoform X1 n=2 Tax=Drosophila simulans TaxID=7240 RepID=UPI00192CEBBD|nr:odorant receptor 63a isoform X1 [Drosophila simulans]
MYSPEEAAELKRRNYRSIREMIRLSYTVGFNLLDPSRCGQVLRIWTIVLSLSSLASLYGHWQMLARYIHDIPRIGETAGTALQFLTSIAKMWYFLFAHRQIYELLRKARCHELLQKCELFERMSDLPVIKGIRQQVESTMNRYWASTRRQILIYLYSCICVTTNYFINSFVINLYRYFTKPKGSYDLMLPLPSLYPAWEHKGLEFPYYHIQMYLETCSLYICGMCAVSFDGVFIVLCLHSVGLVRSLNQMVEHATSELVPPDRRVEYLRCCIYQYQRVANFAAEVNDCFRHITFTQFLLSLFNWGLALFQMSVGLGTNSSITMIRMTMYLVAAGYQIVVYCYNGQRFATAVERGDCQRLLPGAMVRRVQGVSPPHPHDADAHEPGIPAGRVLVHANVLAHADGDGPDKWTVLPAAAERQPEIGHKVE